VARVAGRRLRREARVEGPRLPQGGDDWSVGPLRERGRVAELAVLEGELARAVLHRVVDAALDVGLGRIRHQRIVAGGAVGGNRGADVLVEGAVSPGVPRALVADG